MRDSSARVPLVVMGLLAAGCGGDAFDPDPAIESGRYALGEPAPLMQITPSNLSFSTPISLGSSATQTFTVRNVGPVGSALAVVGPMQVLTSIPGEFTIAQQGCTFPLPAGASCVVTVRAAPVVVGGRNGMIQFMTNEPGNFGAGGLGLVFLAAIGVAHGIQVTPPTIDFGPQLAGTTTVRPLTITSTSEISTMVVSGIQWTNASSSFDFQMGTCGHPLPPRASCTAQVRFFPSANGPQNASFQVLSNGFGPPPTVSLTGTGTVPPPRLEVSPTELDFGDVLLGSSAALDLTYSNTGGSALQVTDLGTGGEFSLATGTCGATPFEIAPGASCTVRVLFTPTAAGLRVSTLFIPAAGSLIRLFGTGVARADLQISMAGPAEAKVKKDITYTITVTNAGPNPATDVVVSDALPDVSTFVGVLADDFTCTTPAAGTNGTVSCQLASLGAGETRTLTVIAHPEHGGKTTITNTATVSSSTSDPEIANNSASVETELKGKK